MKARPGILCIRTMAALATASLMFASCGRESAAPPAPMTAVAHNVSARSVTIEKDAVIGIRLDHPIDCASARVADQVTARVSRDVVVSGRAAIPAGATLEGSIIRIDRNLGGSDRARVGVQFHTLISGDQRVAIQTDPILRLSGPAPSPASSVASFTAAPAEPHIPAGSLLTVKLTAPVTVDR